MFYLDKNLRVEKCYERYVIKSCGIIMLFYVLIIINFLLRYIYIYILN